MKEKIVVVLVKAGETAKVCEISNDYKTFRAIVGGCIECVPVLGFGGLELVCNDEAKLERLPSNRALFTEDGQCYDIVAGDFFVTVANEEGDFISLNQEQVDKALVRFGDIETFLQTKDGMVITRHVL